MNRAEGRELAIGCRDRLSGGDVDGAMATFGGGRRGDAGSRRAFRVGRQPDHVRSPGGAGEELYQLQGVTGLMALPGIGERLVGHIADWLEEWGQRAG